ncbi:MAG TPA: hypothetical protein VGO83_00670, partial [Thermoleophilaceae bacterium]|nr:hypothetical protein [Thermoleophilaceae bacterium]
MDAQAASDCVFASCRLERCVRGYPRGCPQDGAQEARSVELSLLALGFQDARRDALAAIHASTSR